MSKHKGEHETKLTEQPAESPGLETSDEQVRAEDTAPQNDRPGSANEVELEDAGQGDDAPATPAEGAPDDGSHAQAMRDAATRKAYEDRVEAERPAIVAEEDKTDPATFERGAHESAEEFAGRVIAALPRSDRETDDQYDARVRKITSRYP